MSLRTEYESFCSKQEQLLANPMGKRIWMDQESRYVHPFRIFGNVWYVGDSWVCVHLIDTGDGLLLIDSGNCAATAMLVNAIWEAGFNPADVKWIIHSHGHVDHIGGAVFFKKMFGTKLYLGEPDARMFRERPELSLIHESTDISDVLFEPDEVIRDGDVLTFGNTTMRFFMVPGHSEGCIACFFDVYDGERTVRAGYHGGFGFNTLRKEYLQEIGDTELTMRRKYLESLEKVRSQKVELFLGNHCINNQTLERRKKQIADPDGPNPFIDPALWGNYLDAKRDELLAFMADPKNN